ncbi:MAG TPA: cytochrome c peroxidase [Gemmatimonadaceae bacterium]|nr:cytochrome c peroxidase [Gemmatimonadaceae bacterium]
MHSRYVTAVFVARWSFQVVAMLAHRLHRVLAAPTIVFLLAGLSCARSSAATPDSNEGGRRFLADGLTQLANTLANLDSALAFTAAPDPAPKAFRIARESYKHVESLLTYYVPIQASLISGPRADEDDDLPNPPPRSAPVGFQVVEAALFDGFLTRDSARRELGRMRRVLDELRFVTRNNATSASALVDAARLELVRVTVLGLAGFDADPSGDGVIEAAAALDGVRELLFAIGHADETRAADTLLRAAAADLRAHADFGTYDRLRFIVAYVNPIGAQLAELQRRVGLPPPGERRLLRMTAESPFEVDAFDPTAFAPAHARPSTTALRMLGERLFMEPRLSGPGTRACSSCHVPAMAFTDRRPRAAPLPGQERKPLRNTPTLLNVAFEPRLFAEGRTRSLETQVGNVLESHAEMASSVDTVAARLKADSSYRAAFAAAMPDRGTAPLTGLEVRQALAAYLRSLSAMGSRFDRAMRGDTLAVTAAERRGFTVFMGKAKCGTCHFAPLFNGVMPPDYRNAEAEVIGVPATPNLARPVLDPDPGRAVLELVPNNQSAFKVPALRNVALTAPYMHNGVFATLEQVVDFYDRGGGAGLGLALPQQTLPSTPLKLTPAEKRELVAFMGALTDTAFLKRPAPATP